MPSGAIANVPRQFVLYDELCKLDDREKVIQFLADMSYSELEVLVEDCLASNKPKEFPTASAGRNIKGMMTQETWHTIEEYGRGATVVGLGGLYKYINQFTWLSEIRRAFRKSARTAVVEDENIRIMRDRDALRAAVRGINPELVYTEESKHIRKMLDNDRAEMLLKQRVAIERDGYGGQRLVLETGFGIMNTRADFARAADAIDIPMEIEEEREDVVETRRNS